MASAPAFDSFLAFCYASWMKSLTNSTFCPHVGHFRLLVYTFALFSCLLLCFRGKIHTSSIFFCPRMGHFKLLVSTFTPNPCLTLMLPGQNLHKFYLFCPAWGILSFLSLLLPRIPLALALPPKPKIPIIFHFLLMLPRLYLHLHITILLWRNPKFFLKCPIEVGVILESKH